MAVAPNTNINIPYSPFLNDQTGRPNTEWLQWLMNPQFITLSLGSALPVTSGGTGLTTIPTNGQLLIGNGTGYTLNPLTPGVGIGVTNGAGLITVANTGVLSWSGGSTGLTPATATTGVVTLAGTLGAGYGGTGLNTYVIGDLLYASGTTAFSRLADIATGNALISGGIATAPSWGKIGLTTHVSGTLPIANGGTNGTATATAGAIAYGTGTAYAFTAAGTLGQVLTSAGAGTPTWSAAATGTVTSVSVVSANGLAGTVATATTTPAITLSTTITGLLKGNGTAISAATSGTDYAPATSGTSILYGNGAGGFSNVTIGTGVAFAGGTLSATGSGGTVTSVAALTLGTTGTDLSSTVANGTTTPVITLQVPTASASNRGALSAADWTTFNNKGSGTVTSVTGTAPVVSSGGATPAISMAAATTSVNGYLTSTDWTTFNSKQPAGSYLVSGGALGTPSSGTVTNLTGTASININGTVGATTPDAGAFTTLSATGITTVAAGSAALPAIVSTTGTADTGIWFPAADTVAASTAGVEALRIDSSGNLLVATTSVIQGGKLSVAGAICSQTAGAGFSANLTTTTGDQFYFRTDSGANLAGYITSPTSSTTQYLSISDYRLKDNVAPMSGALGLVLKLKPVTYTWKSDGANGQGFIAHELQAVVPDCVGGTKDAVDAEGNPKYQGIDTSFLVATLTAAIQELKIIVDTQAVKIAVLEDK